jgi:hypothetical protein
MSRPDAVQRTARGSLLASVVLMIASFAAGLPMLPWWVAGLVPLLLLCGSATVLDRRAAESDRGLVAYALLLGAFVWMLFVPVAAALVVLALLVAALPCRPWRRPLLARVAILTGALALGIALWSWDVERMLSFAVASLMFLHVATLAGLVLAFVDRE